MNIKKMLMIGVMSTMLSMSAYADGTGASGGTGNSGGDDDVDLIVGVALLGAIGYGIYAYTQRSPAVSQVSGARGMRLSRGTVHIHPRNKYTKSRKHKHVYKGPHNHRYSK